MNVGQVGTKYAYDNLESYKEGYQQGREDEQKKILEWFNEKNFQYAERAMYAYLEYANK